MTFRRLLLTLGVITACHAHGVSVARAHPVAPQDWHDVKCARYRKAWVEVLGREGPQGLGQDFLDRHAAFLASNCTKASDVCPRSPQELKLANIMVMRSMDFGAASTFAPFYCH